MVKVNQIKNLEVGDKFRVSRLDKRCFRILNFIGDKALVIEESSERKSKFNVETYVIILEQNE